MVTFIMIIKASQKNRSTFKYEQPLYNFFKNMNFLIVFFKQNASRN